MKTVALDVHADMCQLALVTKDGEVLLEMQVQTAPEELRRMRPGQSGNRPRNTPLRHTSPDYRPGILSASMR